MQINELFACQFAMLQAVLIQTYPNLWRWPLLCVVALWVVGCTSIGAQDESAFGNTEFGPAETLRICVLLDDPKITQQSAAPIIASMTRESVDVREAMALKVERDKAAKNQDNQSR